MSGFQAAQKLLRAIVRFRRIDGEMGRRFPEPPTERKAGRRRGERHTNDQKGYSRDTWRELHQSLYR